MSELSGAGLGETSPELAKFEISLSIPFPSIPSVSISDGLLFFLFIEGGGAWMPGASYSKFGLVDFGQSKGIFIVYYYQVLRPYSR